MSEQMQNKVTDPVCQMQVDKRTAAAEAEHEGQTYYFCSRQCRDQFQANPQKYVHQSQAIE